MDIGRLLRSVWMQWLNWQARQSIRFVLRSFDERMLREIGLPRYEIEPTLRGIDRSLHRHHCQQLSSLAGNGASIRPSI